MSEAVPSEVVLFDLGGVLVQLSGVGAVQELAGMDDEAEVWRRWLGCEWVRRFERGLCSEIDFAAGVVADWNMATSPLDFLAVFRGWAVGTYDGALDLVDEVAGRARLGCVSNTNGLHWAEMSGWGLQERFEFRFLSHEIGMIKPDREIFEHVVATVGVPAENILFLDDNVINVEGATAVGLDAVVVKGLT
jgi:glucose-1-phosphatase